MSIKNFLSYIFKDNDPTTTDLFDANWGNGVTELLKHLSSTQRITIRSDDRTGQLALDKGDYIVLDEGTSLGYPSNWVVIMNFKYGQNLGIQLAFNYTGLWSRAVNNTGSSMKWERMDGLASTSRVVGGTFPTQVGWQNAVTLDVSSLGAFPYILNFRYRNTNGVWQDANKYASALQGGAGTTISVQLDNAAAAGMRFEIVVSKTF